VSPQARADGDAEGVEAGARDQRGRLSADVEAVMSNTAAFFIGVFSTVIIVVVYAIGALADDGENF
jgi:hypothetical protein